MTIKTRALVGAVAAFVLMGNASPMVTQTSGSAILAAPNVTDLRGVEELQGLFNRDAGKVRLVLLVSPT